MFDVMEFANFVEIVENADGFEGTYTRYEVDDDALYPALIAHIESHIASGEFPVELIDNEVRNPEVPQVQRARLFLKRAQALPREAWILALIPRDDVDGLFVQVKEAPDIPDIDPDALLAALRAQSGETTEVVDVMSLLTAALQLRTAALDVARHWFDAALRNAAGPIIIRHYSSNPDKPFRQ